MCAAFRAWVDTGGLQMSRLDNVYGVLRFAWLMWRRLESKHRVKDHWAGYGDANFYLDCMEQHLQRAGDSQPDANRRRQCVDVANYAMMLEEKDRRGLWEY